MHQREQTKIFFGIGIPFNSAAVQRPHWLIVMLLTLILILSFGFWLAWTAPAPVSPLTKSCSYAAIVDRGEGVFFDIPYFWGNQVRSWIRLVVDPNTGRTVYQNLGAGWQDVDSKYPQISYQVRNRPIQGLDVFKIPDGTARFFKYSKKLKPSLKDSSSSASDNDALDASKTLSLESQGSLFLSLFETTSIDSADKQIGNPEQSREISSWNVAEWHTSGRLDPTHQYLVTVSSLNGSDSIEVHRTMDGELKCTIPLPAGATFMNRGLEALEGFVNIASSSGGNYCFDIETGKLLSAPFVGGQNRWIYQRDQGFLLAQESQPGPYIPISCVIEESSGKVVFESNLSFSTFRVDQNTNTATMVSLDPKIVVIDLNNAKIIRTIEPWSWDRFKLAFACFGIMLAIWISVWLWKSAEADFSPWCDVAMLTGIGLSVFGLRLVWAGTPSDQLHPDNYILLAAFIAFWTACDFYAVSGKIRWSLRILPLLALWCLPVNYLISLTADRSFPPPDAGASLPLFISTTIIVGYSLVLSMRMFGIRLDRSDDPSKIASTRFRFDLKDTFIVLFEVSVLAATFRLLQWNRWLDSWIVNNYGKAIVVLALLGFYFSILCVLAVWFTLNSRRWLHFLFGIALTIAALCCAYMMYQEPITMYSDATFSFLMNSISVLTLFSVGATWLLFLPFRLRGYRLKWKDAPRGAGSARNA